MTKAAAWLGWIPSNKGKKVLSMRCDATCVMEVKADCYPKGEHS